MGLTPRPKPGSTQGLSDKYVALDPGTTLGPYSVTAKIGEG